MYFCKNFEWFQKTLVKDMRMLSLISGSKLKKENCLQKKSE